MVGRIGTSKLVGLGGGIVPRQRQRVPHGTGRTPQVVAALRCHTAVATERDDWDQTLRLDIVIKGCLIVSRVENRDLLPTLSVGGDLHQGPRDVNVMELGCHCQNRQWKETSGGGGDVQLIAEPAIFVALRSGLHPPVRAFGILRIGMPTCLFIRRDNRGVMGGLIG